LAGVPGAGKSALAAQIADSIAAGIKAQGVQAGLSPAQVYKQPGVLILSLEMSAEEMAARLTAYRAGIKLTDLLEGRWQDDTAERLIEAQRYADHMPLRIYEMGRVPFRLLAAKLRMHLSHQPERLVVVDHLLVMDQADDGQKGRRGLDTATVALLTADLKDLARKTGVPFLVLTHIPREVGKRTDPRPTQADIKWAGEGDADYILFAHRPIMFLPRTAPPRSAKEGDEAYEKRKSKWYEEIKAAEDLCEFVVAKRRQGRNGIYRLRFDGPTTSFSEWSDAGPVDISRAEWE
jgi:replicative DNA helicase